MGYFSLWIHRSEFHMKSQNFVSLFHWFVKIWRWNLLKFSNCVQCMRQIKNTNRFLLGEQHTTVVKYFSSFANRIIFCCIDLSYFDIIAISQNIHIPYKNLILAKHIRYSDGPEIWLWKFHRSLTRHYSYSQKSLKQIWFMLISCALMNSV